MSRALAGQMLSRGGDRGLGRAAAWRLGASQSAAAVLAARIDAVIFRGIATVDTTRILAGTVPAALLAVAADGGLGWIETQFAPL